jgi:ribonuclease P protein component
MLPSGSRLHTSDEFSAVVRSGRRSASGGLVVHLLVDPASSSSARASRVGFVVSGKVGNAVVRHRVTRRLRVLVRPLLTDLPSGSELVVRALPAAAAASSAELGRDLRSAAASALRKARAAGSSRAPARVGGAG